MNQNTENDRKTVKTFAVPAALFLLGAAIAAGIVTAAVTVYLSDSLAAGFAAAAVCAVLGAAGGYALIKKKLLDPLEMVTAAYADIADLQGAAVRPPAELPAELSARQDEAGRLAGMLQRLWQSVHDLFVQMNTAADARAHAETAAALRRCTVRPMPGNDRFTLDTQSPAQEQNDGAVLRAFYADDTHLALALTRQSADTFEQSLEQYTLCTVLESGAMAGLHPKQILELLRRQFASGAQEGTPPPYSAWIGIVDLELGRLVSAQENLPEQWMPCLCQRDGTLTPLPAGASAELMPGDGILAKDGEQVLLHFTLETLRQNNSIVTDGAEDSRDAVLHFTEEKLAEVSAEIRKRCGLTVAELYTNIAKNSGASLVCVTCRVVPGAVELSFRDNGAPYDALDTASTRSAGVAKDRSLGGIGIFVARKYMRDVEYRRVGAENRLTMKCSL